MDGAFLSPRGEMTAEYACSAWFSVFLTGYEGWRRTRELGTGACCFVVLFTWLSGVGTDRGHGCLFGSWIPVGIESVSNIIIPPGTRRGGAVYRRDEEDRGGGCKITHG